MIRLDDILGTGGELDREVTDKQLDDAVAELEITRQVIEALRPVDSKRRARVLLAAMALAGGRVVDERTDCTSRGAP